MSLSRELGCKIVEISALKGTGIMEAAEAAIEGGAECQNRADAHASPVLWSMRLPTSRRLRCMIMPEEQQRWYAIKIFERDDKVMAQLIH